MTSLICALACASLGSTVPSATGPTYELINHVYGWGMRIDNYDKHGREQKQYFDFSTGVTLTLDPATNQAYIQGTVRHIESNQLWDISATLGAPLLTSANPGSPWHSSAGNTLYNSAIDDLLANGANHYAAGEGNLKNANYAADRLAFLSGVTNLTLQPGQGGAVFNLPGQTDGAVTLYDFPQASDMIPFMLAKGHRISPTSEEVAGFGWMDARPPSQQSGDDGLVQDYLFRIGEKISQANLPPDLTFTLDGGNGPVAGNITVNEGSSVVYAATGADGDPGEVLTLSIEAHHLGGLSSNAPPPSGPSPLSDSLTISHFDDAASLSATAKVTDSAGETASITRAVTVLNVVPTLTQADSVAAVRSGGGEQPIISLAATDPGEDTVTFFIQPQGGSGGGFVATAQAPITVEATGQTTSGSTRTATATLDPYVGLGSHAFTITARDEDQPNVDSNAAPVKIDVVGPVMSYAYTQYDANGNPVTRDGQPLGDSVNPGGVVHTGELIDFGNGNYRRVELMLTNNTPNSDQGELTALSIVDAIIDGRDAHQFSLWEADGVSPFDPDAHEALAPGESLPLLVMFSPDARWGLADQRTAALTFFTDQGAAFGGDGADFQFDLAAFQVPEPTAVAIWLLLGGGGALLFFRRRQ